MTPATKYKVVPSFVMGEPKLVDASQLGAAVRAAIDLSPIGEARVLLDRPTPTESTPDGRGEGA